MSTTQYYDVKDVAVLEGASIFIGFSLLLSTYSLVVYGLGWKLHVDQERQKVLSLIVLLLAIVGAIKHGQQVTSGNVMVYNILLLLQWVLALVELCIINHNSSVRLTVAFKNITPSATTVKWSTALMYVLILTCITPAVLAAMEQYPRKNLSASTHATVEYKIISLVLVVLTELVATISDIILIRTVTQGKHDGQAVRKAVKHDMKRMYTAIWITLGCDIVFKLLSVTGAFTPNFDTHCTNFSMALRACTNLRFGTTLIEVVQGNYTGSRQMSSKAFNSKLGSSTSPYPPLTPISVMMPSTPSSIAPPKPPHSPSMRGPSSSDLRNTSSQNLFAPLPPRRASRNDQGVRPSTRVYRTRDRSRGEYELE